MTFPQLLQIIEGLLYIDVRHASAWTVERIVFMFGISELSVESQFPLNMHILPPKIGACQMGPEHRMIVFSRLALGS
jgi:hypothetical protein